MKPIQVECDCDCTMTVQTVETSSIDESGEKCRMADSICLTIEDDGEETRTFLTVSQAANLNRVLLDAIQEISLKS